MFLILVLVIAISVFGCAKKTPRKTVNHRKQAEQKKPSEEESKPSIKKKEKIKFTIKGQKTFGEEYEQAEGTGNEYVSTIEKEEGETVKPSELLDVVKGKINETIYNKDQMSYKHDGEAVGEMQPIKVKAPSTVIEFYVKRQIRTITLDTDKAVSVSNVKGAVEIADGNKTLKFRHGYSFVDDETPTIVGTEEDEFNGWLNGEDIYRFGNPNSVTSDTTLIPNMRKREAIVNINLNGLRAEGLQYADSGILGMPDSTGNKITLRVPCERFKNYSVYRLTNLKTENGAVFYNETTQKQVRHTGYIGDRWIYEEGKTYEVTAAYTEESETIYKGMYPQTKKSISGTIVDTKKTYSLMYGTFDVITSYSKGKKYEKIGSDYYLYEPVEIEEFPACKDWQKWTVNTIDISIFHKYNDDSNIYANSYIKQYLEQVVKAKLQATSVALPKLKNTTTDVLPDDEAEKYCGLDSQQQELKYKKITDYATAVRSNYQSLRGISVVFYPGEYYSQYTWLGTRDDISLRSSYSIDPWGRLSNDDTYCTFGLRPAISI